MSTTVRITEACTECEECLDKITLYVQKWTDAVHDDKPTSFNIGTDGFAEFEEAG